MSDQPSAFFVYGTLKRGEERERLWPCVATRIELATARGRLRDLGPYPAMVDGEGRVSGELWFLDPHDVPLALKTLDAIECYDQGGVDLYVRRIIPCQTDNGETYEAFAYFYGSETAIADSPLVEPDESGICSWSAGER